MRLVVVCGRRSAACLLPLMFLTVVVCRALGVPGESTVKVYSDVTDFAAKLEAQWDSFSHCFSSLFNHPWRDD